MKKAFKNHSLRRNHSKDSFKSLILNILIFENIILYPRLYPLFAFDTPPKGT
jgi:hypothetical protein